jgi:hypothetical protein
LQIHYENDIRGLSLTPGMSHADFFGRIATKFGLRGAAASRLRIRFQDEDGCLVSLVDEVRYLRLVSTAPSLTDASMFVAHPGRL